jgi:alpha-L-fucosidase
MQVVGAVFKKRRTPDSTLIPSAKGKVNASDEKAKQESLQTNSSILTRAWQTHKLQAVPGRAQTGATGPASLLLSPADRRFAQPAPQGKTPMARSLTKLPLTLAGLALTQLAMAAGPATRPAPALARPTPEQLAWHDMELEMFLCLDPCTWQNIEYDNHSTPLAKINPEKLDTDQWVRVAKSFGAKQVLFVAKHTGGFCWWQTETSKYGVRQTPWRGGRGDVVKDLAESCRKAGLRLALYLSPQDDQFGAGGGGRCKTPEAQQTYNTIYRQQLTELLSRYGEVSEVWFDGSCVIEVGDILKKHVPRAMIFQGPHATIRWVGNEDGFAPYPAWNSVSDADARGGIATAQHGRPDGTVWMPLEVDTVNVWPHHWFWNNTSARRLRTLDDLLDCYYRSVGHGAVLLLNQTPDTTGLIPEADARRAAEFGSEIARRFGRCIAETRGEGGVIELTLSRPALIDHIITMEQIAEGERVREYVIEALVDGAWREVCRGSAIGHKKIDRCDAVETTKVRLRVTQSAAGPLIRRLAVFFVGGGAEKLGSAHWALNEGQGDVAHDSVGRRTAKIVGAQWAQGNCGKALEFRGSDYQSVGNLDVGDKDFTIAAWVFPRNTSSRLRVIVGKERSGTAPNQLRFALEAGNRLEFDLTGDGAAGLWPFQTSPGAVPAGQWSHVAVTRQGRQFVLYVNGKPAATKSSAALIRHSNRLDLRIGARYPADNDAGGDGFDGRIDEVAFLDRALSAKEMLDPQALSPPSPAASTGTTIAQWTPESIKAAWSDLDINLSASCKKAGQYEIEFRKNGGANDLEIQRVRYLFQGIDTSEFLKPAERPGVYHLNVTGVTGSMLLRATVRGKGGTDSRGTVLLRKL